MSPFTCSLLELEIVLGRGGPDGFSLPEPVPVLPYHGVIEAAT